jgi:hypothetical protein
MIADVPGTIPATRPAGVLLDCFLSELVEEVVELDDDEGDLLPVLVGRDVDATLPELRTAKLLDVAAPLPSAAIGLGLMFSGARAAAALKLARSSGEALIAPTMPFWQCFAWEQ